MRFFFLDSVLLAIGVWTNWSLIRMLGRGRVFNAIAIGIMTSWLILTVDFGLVGYLHLGNWIVWPRALGLSWMVLSVLLLPLVRLSHGIPHAEISGRRKFLQTVGFAAVAAPLAAARAGFVIGHRDALVHEVQIPVDNLPLDLENFRIVQMSDIHLSPFLSRPQLARAIDLANEQRADLALVTGDLISYHGDPLDDCLAELRRLRSYVGTYGCLGNHEIAAGSEDYTTSQGARMGMRFLRHESQVLRIGDAHLNLAGVDYQRKNTPYLEGVAGLRRKGCVNMLLSHNPDVFPVAASQGWDVTIAGHTHGGQITLEYLQPGLNPARFFTPYVFGLYRKGPSSIFVTGGLGTVALPVRLGVPPEIAVIKLVRAQNQVSSVDVLHR